MKTLHRIINSYITVIVRATVLLTMSSLLFWCTALSGQSGPPSPIENERRLTRLETKVEQMAADIKELKDTDWIKLAALALLTGEAGVRHVTNRRNKKE